MTAPPVFGVLETGIYVEDLKRARFLRGRTRAEVDERFCACGADPVSVLLLLFKLGATLESVRMVEGLILRMTAMARCTSYIDQRRFLPSGPRGIVHSLF